MSDTDTSPRMDHQEFRAVLKRLGMSQSDFARLLHSLSREPIYARTINRWATGGRPIPTLIIAILALLEMLPEATLRRLVKKAGGAVHN